MESLEEIQKHLDELINEQNNQGLPDFEGYSPTEMQYILYDTFGENSPIEFLSLTVSEYQKIPILNQVKYLLKLVEKHSELKLTTKGFLPTKIVADIYNQKFIEDEMIEAGISKLYKETDSKSINLTRILLELSGLVKKRNNKLSLTRKGKSVIKDNYTLLMNIFITFGTKFNWAYYDGYGQNSIGQLGFGYPLILLNKYGREKRLDKFYADKYFKAFPKLIESIEPSQFQTKAVKAVRCFSIRTFDRFLNYFGLINIDKEKEWDADKYISKTKIFDKLIKVRPHTFGYTSYRK